MKREARYWHRLDGSRVKCVLCPQNCSIADGAEGVCGVRRNDGGTLVTEIYGEVTGYGIDPIEKKPLYHYYPGRQIISLGTKGCNLKCEFCQNWHISQQPDARSSFMLPEDAVSSAIGEGSFGISYTYSEPLIWIEYVMDAAKLAQEKGLKNVLVTNGFINPEPLDDLIPVIDAANIDVKSFDPEFYTKLCKGKLEPVLRTCEKVSGDWHIELTHLLVPFKGEQEMIDGISNMSVWIAEKLGRNVPLHLSRYFPNYHMALPATRQDLLEKAYQTASMHLDYVYLGNMNTNIGNDTICPECRTVLIKRHGYNVRILNLDGSKCAECGCDTGISGV